MGLAIIFDALNTLFQIDAITNISTKPCKRPYFLKLHQKLYIAR